MVERKIINLRNSWNDIRFQDHRLYFFILSVSLCIYIKKKQNFLSYDQQKFHTLLSKDNLICHL